MESILNKLRSFLRDEEGATAVEYAIMIVLIIVVCLVAVGILGRNVNRGFETVANSLGAVVPGGETK